MSNIEQTILKANLDYIRPSLPPDNRNKDNYVFLIFSMMTVLDIDVTEALKSSSEGGDDNSMDGIYLEQTDNDIIIHIFQSKYRTTEKTLSKPIGKNDIDLSLLRIKNIIEGVEPQRSSPTIKRKIKEIQDVVAEFGSIKFPLVRVYFVTNGVETNKSDKELVKKFENEGNHEVNFLTTKRLLHILDTTNKDIPEINIKTKGNVISQDFMGNIRGLLCTINSKELINLFDAAGRERALEKNIRYFLGNNKINEKIRNTAESHQDSKYFWFYNNGISIVCEKFTPTDDISGNKIIKLKNPKIVNGGQTTKTLFELSKKEDSIFSKETAKDVFLLARIYETDDIDLIDKITEGTNNQNPTFIRDLKSNNPIQTLIKKYFKLKGFYLETKRNEYRNVTDKGEKIPLKKIVKNDTVFQAYLSLYSDIPHQAKSGKSKAFEDYFSKVFIETDGELPRKFFKSFELLNFVNTKEKEYDTDNGYSFLLHSEFAIIYCISKLWPDIKTAEVVNETILSKQYKKALLIIRKAINKEKESLGEAYSHNKFFKSSNSTSIINTLSCPSRKSPKRAPV